MVRVPVCGLARTRVARCAAVRARYQTVPPATNPVRARLNLRRRWLRLRGRDRFGVPARHLFIETEDQIRIAATRLGPSDGSVAVVVVHALLGYRTKPPWVKIAEALAERFAVYSIDLRGHGDSGGECSGGPLEANEVRAAIARARADGFRTVITVGGSLGGSAVIFEAASSGAADLAVAISPPPRWAIDLLHHPSADGGSLRRRLVWLFRSRAAMRGASLLFGVRMARHWVGGEPPIEVVDRLRTPLFVIHGADDHLFPIELISELVSRAATPTGFWLLETFGHCEDGFTSEWCATFTRRLVRIAESGFDPHVLASCGAEPSGVVS